MKRFLLLYCGPPTPADASHQGWPEWFTKLGDALVDLGSPMTNRFVLGGDGSTSDDAATLNGYSIIQADDASGARDLIDGHPLLALGEEYSIEVFEVPKR